MEVEYCQSTEQSENNKYKFNLYTVTEVFYLHTDNLWTADIDRPTTIRMQNTFVNLAQ